MKTATRYRAPTRSEYVEVSLDDFTDEELREHMENRGVEASMDDDDLLIKADELNRLFTLVLCGQSDSARQWVLEVVGKKIGKALA